MEWTQATFWATAGQVIPVLGIGLAIEARSVAKGWTPDATRKRQVEALIILVLAVLLSLAFGITLSALAKAQDGPSWQVAGVTTVMQVAFYVLVIGAMSLVAGRGLVDLRPYAYKWVPLSPSWRTKRKTKRILANLPQEVSEAQEYKARAQEITRQARAESVGRRLLSEGELDRLKGYVNGNKGNWSDKEIVSSLRDTILEYQARPSLVRARAVRSQYLRLCVHLLARTRLQLLRLDHIKWLAETLIEDINLGRMSDTDRQLTIELIEAASQASFLPWLPKRPN